MSLNGLECQVSKLVNSDTRPRPTTQDVFACETRELGATKLMEHRWKAQEGTLLPMATHADDCLFSSPHDVVRSHLRRFALTEKLPEEARYADLQVSHGWHWVALGGTVILRCH